MEGINKEKPMKLQQRNALWTRIGVSAATLALAAAGRAIPIHYAANGHSYEVFEAPAILWDDANAAAIARGGYLATLTDAAENQFVFDNVVVPAFGTGNGGVDGVQAWIGGFQPLGSPEPDGGWQWVTGEAWSFTNWAPGEPNNAGQGTERHLTINRFGTQQWNDEGSRIVDVRGYLVEFESVPEGGPTIMLFAVGVALLTSLRRFGGIEAK